MATTRDPIRTFEDWYGLDKTLSVLTKDKKSFLELKNVERLANGSLRASKGFKLAAQPIYMFGIHTYQYVDDDGVPQEEIIGVGLNNPGVFDTSVNDPQSGDGLLYRLKTGTFTITYSGGNDWGFSILPKDTTEGSEFVLSENGVEVFTDTLGFGNASDLTLKGLADGINAITDFSCTAPETAVCSGATSGSQFNVNSGHTVSVGTYLNVPSAATAINGSGKHWVEIIATTSNALTWYFNQAGSTVAASTVIGHGTYPANILDWQTLTESPGSSKTISYQYWEPIRGLYWNQNAVVAFFSGTKIQPFEKLADDFGKDNIKLPTFTNHNNSCYISAAYADESKCVKLVGRAGDGISSQIVDEEFYAGTWKYDGVNAYLSGPVQLADIKPVLRNVGAAFNLSYFFDVTDASSGTALGPGIYLYQMSIMKTDGRGVEIESFLEFIRRFSSALTKNANIDINLVDSSTKTYFHNAHKYDIRHGVINGAVSSASTSFTLDANQPFRTGDYVYFEDDNGEIQRRKVTAWTNTTITLDEAATVADNEVIGNALIRLWRTKESGNEFFLSTSAVYQMGTSGFQTITDSTTDANLGIKLISIKQETIQYSFPAVNTLASHQSVLVGGGGPKFPQSIVWEDAVYPESLDLARGVRSVPAKQSGGINVIKSHTDSSLIIAKCGGIYEAVGSFENNEVEITKISENSHGAKSTNGITEIDNVLVGACEMGIFSIDQVRNISSVIGTSILDLFRQNDAAGLASKIKTNRFVFHYDIEKQWIHVFLPRETAYDVTNFSGSRYAHQTDSEYYIYQLAQNEFQQSMWTERTFNQNTYPSGGITNLGQDLYWQTNIRNSDFDWTGYLYRRLDDETDLQENCWTEDGRNSSLVIIPQWDDNGYPEYYKVWDEFILYQLQEDYYKTSFTLAFESYRDWVTNGTKTDTSRASNLAFSSSTTKEKYLQFDKGYKAKRRTFKLSATVYKNPPVVTGYTFTRLSDLFSEDKVGRIP